MIKRKQLIVILTAVVMLSVGLVLYSKRHAFFPSQQMKDLRQLEARLNLPEPKYRYEEDLGLTKDSKGATHYERHIALSYEDASVSGLIKTKLLNDSWQEQTVSVEEASNSFSFKKGTGNAAQCVSGFVRPKNTDGITLYISLAAAGEYACNPAPGV